MSLINFKKIVSKKYIGWALDCREDSATNANEWRNILSSHLCCLSPGYRFAIDITEQTALN